MKFGRFLTSRQNWLMHISTTANLCALLRKSLICQHWRYEFQTEEVVWSFEIQIRLKKMWSNRFIVLVTWSYSTWLFIFLLTKYILTSWEQWNLIGQEKNKQSRWVWSCDQNDEPIGPHDLIVFAFQIIKRLLPCESHSGSVDSLLTCVTI